MENLGDDLEARGLVYNPLDGRVRPEWAVANDQLRDYYDYEWGALATTEAEFFERVLGGFAGRLIVESGVE